MFRIYKLTQYDVKMPVPEMLTREHGTAALSLLQEDYDHIKSPPVPANFVLVDDDEAYYMCRGGEIINIGNEAGRRMFEDAMFRVCPHMTRFLRTKREVKSMLSAMSEELQRALSVDHLRDQMDRTVEETARQLERSMEDLISDLPSDDDIDTAVMETANEIFSD